MPGIICYFTGCLRIIVEGDFVERFINMCSYHGIEIWNLRSVGGGYEMNIVVSDFRKLKPYLRKTNSKVTIKEREGFPFFLHRNRKRALFLIGALLCVFLLYASTFYLWGIEIEGNLYYTEEVLLENLSNENIVCGMRKERVNCNGITQFLRETFDNITWASAYITGTKLVIHIKENNEIEKQPIEREIGKSIVADYDGCITGIVTRSGTPMVHPGDVVKKGDILVSGIIEVQNDAGETIEEKGVIPDASITAQVILSYEDQIERTYLLKEYTGKKQRNFLVELGDTVFTVGGRKHKFEKYVTTYQNIKLTKSARFGMKSIKEYVEIEKKYGEKECQRILSSQFVKFCHELEKKGVQILENDVKIYTESNCALAKGNVTVCRKIGTQQ